MSIGGGKNDQRSKSYQEQSSNSSSSNSSRPSTAAELASYWNQLNAQSGGNVQNYAGSAPSIGYQALTADQLRAMGGAGEMRRLAAQRTYQDLMNQTNADPRLSVFQRQYAGEQANRELAGNLDAINAETEASLTELAAKQRENEMQRQVEQRKLYDQQIANLIDLFYGGQGTYSQGQSSSQSSGKGTSSGRGSGFDFRLAFGS